MADTAVSTGELAAQRREHLPRQQPHLPLRHNSGGGAHEAGVRPMSYSGGARGDHGQAAGMGPHPGAVPVPVPVVRAGSNGGEAYDRHGAPGRVQAKASYLQQRATGTAGEHVFNARDPVLGGGEGAAAAVAPSGGSQGHGQHHQQSQHHHHQQQQQQQAHRSSTRRMVGPYQLAKTIGAGSMGKVKVALDTRTNKRVAAKIIPLQQPDAPMYFPAGGDSTRAEMEEPGRVAGGSEPVNPTAEPWLSWLAGLALESHGDLAAAAHVTTGVTRRLRLLQPRERYTTKDRERRENRDIRIVREVAINRLLHHPHICMLHDVVVHPNHYYIFQELVSGGQMLDYIISHGRLKEKHARKFARQIASAIDYCHRNSIVHRDLKIENILISASGNIKLIDFGLSNVFSPRAQLSTFCGSLYFAAPELLNAQPYTGPEVDLWSFGVVLYVLVCGKVPFDDQSMPALHAKIKRGHVEYPAWLSSECRHLLGRLLVVVATRRATMGEVVRHAWMTRGYGDVGRVDALVPARVPLVAAEQIDAAVVREMAQYIGFGFGGEDEIRLGLEAILTEDWYRAWLKDALRPELDAVRTHIRTRVEAERAATAATAAAAAAAAAERVESQADEPADAAAAKAKAKAEPTTAEQATAEPAPYSAPIRRDHLRAAGGDGSGSGVDAVRKRSSFWKRSSTFIAAGLGRSAQRGDAGAGAGAAIGIGMGSAGASAERTALASAGGGAAATTHSPRLMREGASNMMRIWHDGKLAPDDTDYAAIQREYHDIVATDPLLSVYFLVKERRERERAAALPPAQAQAQALPASASASQHQPQAQPASAPNPNPNDVWVKLERAPARVAPAADSRVAHDLAAVLAPDGPGDGASVAGSEPAPSTGATAAAIEALSANPRARGTAGARGSGSLLAAAGGSSGGGGGSGSTGGFADGRRRRANIFKRFSVIVKGARAAPQRLADGDEQQLPQAQQPRIVQAEGAGSETGFMEITVQRTPSATSAAAGTGAAITAATAAAGTVAAAAAPEAAAAAAAATTTERPAYATLDSIDEHSTPSHAPDSAVGSQAAMVTATAATAATADQPTTRQYLTKSLAPTADGSSAADEALAAVQEPPPSRSLDDLDGASSMFTATDDGNGDDATAQQQQRQQQQQPSADAGSSAADTAALLDRARREIEGLDAHAGVGLLDQTPELSYRQAAAIKKDAFDAKRRARSSSNTVVRVLSEIVRDPASGARHIPGFTTIAGHRAARAPPAAKTQAAQEQAAVAPARTVQRHSSTGAINQASDAAAAASQHDSATAAAAAAAAAAGRPDILRSHSHNASHPLRALALPERIAELPEPPTPREQPATEPLESSEPSALSPPQSQSQSQSQSPSPSPAAASPTEPSPRADEYLKPVFLKGLFSVATTSTRSPTAIRDNLLAVLARMPLRFHEGKGYFTCSVAAAAAPANLHASGNASGNAAAYAHDGLSASAASGLHRHKKSLRLPGVDRKLSFRRRREPLADELASSDDVLLDSTSAAESAGPAVHVPAASPGAICFQIFLVRMPLLGLCGLQFRRVSGPAWQYKDICSDILKRLQL
ncbi:Serine/threonine-protein kinase [Coemansia erecta]|uniref:non-specific serine/threonine protein kinase n=1 Tax=Coemansia erecta TaxID=147472 RepID=A0A9W8CPQ0_9FUNG|nr:Serine/threonine-protein kinase [Coemansia erecta]